MRGVAAAVCGLVLGVTGFARASGEPADFGPEARLLWRVVACGGEEPLPEGIDAPTVQAHCGKLLPKMRRYEERYVRQAREYIAALRPAGSPATVVYPFGGGDLVSALTTYPDATEITTLSLEHAGDPRRVRGIGRRELRASLSPLRRAIAGLMVADNSTSETLMKLERGEFPGQLSYFLAALAVHGYEPVTLRYFQLEPDGSIRYLSAADIAELEGQLAPRLRRGWTPPDDSVAFSNSELTFRPKGAGAGAPVRIHRHIAADLADSALAADPSVLAHLRKKGRISAITKAASYLLWRNAFSRIRDYLLSNMELMVSDSTGIPPRFARDAGFVQEGHGRFDGSFLGANARDNADFRKLWKAGPFRPLPFRYGYPDAAKHWHLLVTRKAAR